MLSVGQAFEEFLKDLELKDTQLREVIRQHTVVRENLRRFLAPGYKTDFLSGSYSRRTAIRPLHDIDIFVILGETQGTPSSHAIAALQRVQQALGEAYPKKKLPIVQQHSVNIEFSESGIAFDVVPSFQSVQQEEYFIPQRDTGRWICTNPQRHEELGIEANEKAGKKLKPLLKAAKHWKRRQRSRPFTSFHLEAMSYSAFSRPPATYLEGLVQLFEHLSHAVMGPCPDPAGLGPDIDKYMDASARHAARDMTDGAAQLARRALAAATTRQLQAHAHLRELFGPEYPERGEL